MAAPTTKTVTGTVTNASGAPVTGTTLLLDLAPVEAAVGSALIIGQQQASTIGEPVTVASDGTFTFTLIVDDAASYTITVRAVGPNVELDAGGNPPQWSIRPPAAADVAPVPFGTLITTVVPAGARINLDQLGEVDPSNPVLGNAMVVKAVSPLRVGFGAIAAGSGLPAGGTTGQVLARQADGTAAWQTPIVQSDLQALSNRVSALETAQTPAQAVAALTASLPAVAKPNTGGLWSQLGGTPPAPGTFGALPASTTVAGRVLAAGNYPVAAADVGALPTATTVAGQSRNNTGDYPLSVSAIPDAVRGDTIFGGGKFSVQNGSAQIYVTTEDPTGTMEATAVWEQMPVAAGGGGGGGGTQVAVGTVVANAAIVSGAGSTALTVPITTAVPAGTTLVVCAGTSGLNTTTTVTDSAGNVYPSISDVSEHSTDLPTVNSSVRKIVLTRALATTDTITLTPSASGVSLALVAFTLAAVATGSASYGPTSVGTGTAAAVTGAGIPSVTAGSLVIAAVCCSLPAGSPPSAFTAGAGGTVVAVAESATALQKLLGVVAYPIGTAGAFTPKAQLASSRSYTLAAIAYQP